MRKIPIIDIFAGPGGLGEGFTSLTNKNKERIFRIALSIEKDEFAHRTLTLRSFVRQFPIDDIPDEYYSFVKGELTIEELYKKYPLQSAHAKLESWKIEVGDKSLHRIIDKRIKDGLKGEKNFILIGGPPCQAYSLVGRSRRQQKEGLDENDPRVYLYREYYRILAVHKPQVFIMENVKGILSSKVNNESVFNQIIRDLRNPLQAYIALQGKEELDYQPPAYRIYSLVAPIKLDLYGEEIFDPRSFIIKTEDYGIPQTRHRVILLGIRNDLNVIPDLLDRGEQINVSDVISELPSLRSGLSKGKDDKMLWKQILEDSFNSTIWDTVEKDVRQRIKEELIEIRLPENDRGSLYLKTMSVKPPKNSQWYIDVKLEGVCNHETRSHIIEDLYRYLFVSCFAKVKGRSPKLSDFPVALLPKHLNVGKGITENKFADRFRVQLSDQPSKTITSHISKDGHYYIHPDPSQCRSLTVREAARLQTFPDNYFFCGPRTEQYHQVGNAVPPYLAFQIAKIVSRLV